MTETEQLTISYPVFDSGDGNKFIFPGFFSSSDHERTATYGQCLSYELALGVVLEKERLEVVVQEDGMLNFPHVVAGVGHPGFAHGGADIYIVAGPTFDMCSGGSDVKGWEPKNES